MSITSIPSYVSTTGEFDSNWEQANTELGPAPLLLAGAYTRALFISDRSSLISLIGEVTNKAGLTRAAEEARDNLRADLLGRHKQFRGTVQGLVTNPAALRDTPPQPDARADAIKFIEPFVTIVNLWRRFNANPSDWGLTGEFVIAASFSVDDLQELVDAVVPAYTAVQNASEAEAVARQMRDNAMAAIYARMKQYRGLLPTLLPKNSPAVANMPRLTPAPGTTPPPLGATGNWDNVLGLASASWTASTDAAVDKIQVRGCTGGTYKNEREELVATLPANATGWTGNFALTAPGAIASFKFYAMTTTGNENGGKAVKIVRPVT